ncbi:uncharacterized protein AB675_9848 [Cyphellophora attinorum]|uniref:DUF6594 domain-containing protein n=1 Tax=Cyphellophora attinorum TaxID=1664694 RepID=A0A0N0NP55_9EURO|nr:uncharacterized protein AB675_9848 [Phialophora attinorum]KPI42328.1 hypothetical protein AB675_9848 [Phialophora attinorum]
MTAIASPVEIGSGRRSVYIDSSNAPDVTDPNWIPMLGGGAIQKEQEETMFSEKEVSPYNEATFPPVAKPSTPKEETRPKSPEKKQSLKHSHSKSSPSSSKSPFTSPLSVDPRESNDGHETATSEGDGSTAPSTAGTASMIEEQYYTLPGMEVAKEDIVPPTAPISARSSIMSSRAKSPFVPTSKYNRKGIQSIASVNRPATIRSQPSSPQESPRVSAALPTSTVSLPPSEQLQSPHLPISTSASSTPVTSPKLVSSKSTASDRRARALHSHPSDKNLQQSMPAQPPPREQSLPRGRSHSRSRPESGSGEIDLDVLPKPPSVKHRSRKQSIESRPTTPRSIYDSQVPTPAPTTPLPQLPPEAFASNSNNNNSRRPSVRTISRPSEGHIASASLVSLPRPSEHAEMADFMSRKSAVIFRRFDDVHVKLLLCLQDEISGLEEQLFALEQDAHENSIDRPGQKMRVMRELRRVVAEYDHLFANWSQMQANKADPQTMKDLREWLESPKAGSGGREDLDWLNRQKDLSTVRLGAADQSVNAASKEKASAANDAESAPSKKSSGGGFAGLFNCAGRRK